MSLFISFLWVNFKEIKDFNIMVLDFLLHLKLCFHALYHFFVIFNAGLHHFNDMLLFRYFFLEKNILRLELLLSYDLLSLCIISAHHLLILYFIFSFYWILLSTLLAIFIFLFIFSIFLFLLFLSLENISRYIFSIIKIKQG